MSQSNRNGSRRYPAECAPHRVGAVLCELAKELTSLPGLPADAGWDELAKRAAWRVEWWRRQCVQYARLGTWAQATRQPDAVVGAIFNAEWSASNETIRAEALATDYLRRAVKAAIRSGGTRAVA